MIERAVAIIGDVGGQLQVFRQVLEDLDVDLRTRTLPRGLSVIQVGDLVRVTSSKSLDSEGCLRLAHDLSDVNGSRWIQLLGNHEAAFLGGPRKSDWPDHERGGHLADLLNDGWRRRRYAMAASFGTPDGDFLVTHAGLTVAAYLAIGEPSSAKEAASRVNLDMARDPGVVFTGGCMTDPGTDFSTDVTWADAGRELYPHWIERGSAPFHQIHGHASAWDWQQNRWWPSTPPQVRMAVALDHGGRRSSVRLADGHHLSGVDWALGDLPLGRVSWETWVIRDVIPHEVGQ